MTADDARKLAKLKQAPRPEIVKVLLETYYEAIRREAEVGHTLVKWSQIPKLRTLVSSAEKEAARQQLLNDGFDIYDDMISWQR